MKRRWHSKPERGREREGAEGKGGEGRKALALGSPPSPGRVCSLTGQLAHARPAARSFAASPATASQSAAVPTSSSHWRRPIRGSVAGPRRVSRRRVARDGVAGARRRKGFLLLEVLLMNVWALLQTRVGVVPCFELPPFKLYCFIQPSIDHVCDAAARASGPPDSIGLAAAVS